MSRQLSPPAHAQEPQNLARLPGARVLAESEHRDRWGLDGWHAAYVIDGNRDGKSDGSRITCWASDNWEYTHTLVILFPTPVKVSGATLFWAAPGDTPLTSRRFTVEGFAEGKWRNLAAHELAQDEAATEIVFGEARVEAVRVSQPPDGANPSADRRLWVAEVEVKGTPIAAGQAVAVQDLAERFRKELADRRQAEAEARVKPLLDTVMRTPKTRGFMGIINREDLARGRANIAKHPWAKHVVEGVCSQADWWLDKSDEYIYSLIPAENPRALCPSFEKGCPIHGGARNSFTATMDAPFRWKCNVGGEEWYGGAVLKNPKTGEEITVKDDGSGWKAPEGFSHPGLRYYFTAAYRYFILGKLFGNPYEGDRGGGAPGSNAVHQLSLAYAFTGDARYAHKAAVMLNRLAELYRFMDGSTEGPSQRQDGYIGQTFERFWVQMIALSCDLVWDEVMKDDELVAFFKAHGGADYDGDGVASPKDVAYNLQRNLLGYIYEYVHRLMPYLDGDFLIYEMGALSVVASTLQNAELAREMLEGEYGLRTLLSTEFFRDGKFIYDSVGYNIGNAQAVASLAEWMHGFEDGVYCKQPLDLYNDPRFRMSELLNFCRYVDCDGRTPQIGDSGGSRGKSLRATAPYSMYDERALLRLSADRQFYATSLLSAAQGDLDSFRDGKADYWLVFHADDALKPKVSGTQPPVEPRSETHLFLDSGIALLRAGSRPESRWHIPLTFSKGSYGHGHPDKLAINLIAAGYDLSADLGYPTTWTDVKYGGWETATASHWTVMLDETGSQSYVMGKLGFYDTSPHLDSVEASCEAAYPGCPLYRRTVALVRESPNGDPLYAVDIFRVAGGKVRDYLHHSLGNPDDMQLVLPSPHGDWAVQTKGTLAGEDVEFASKGGYGFLKDVKRLAYDGPFSAEWTVAGASQPDRYLWTREAYGDCDIEFSVTRTGKASGNQERAVLVFQVDPANPGNRRQTWIDAAGTMLPVGKSVRMRVQVRSGKATVSLDGQVVERATEVIGAPPARGRVGFLHYYNYSYLYDDLTITPANDNVAPVKADSRVRDDFLKPLDQKVWDRIEPTYC
ncbi:MAG: heparinase II/III family protein, partial [Armatimonadetes bacterium]|nr:heparinase II/III family protein [Armatimonadota bacterium]